jgi:Arc/MetJ family transcription regulator
VEIEWEKMIKSKHHFVHIMMRYCMHVWPVMRTTLNIDDELLAQAQQITGITEKTALVRDGLLALIRQESARRLALLGASEPQLKPVRRQRSTTK